MGKKGKKGKNAGGGGDATPPTPGKGTAEEGKGSGEGGAGAGSGGGAGGRGGGGVGEVGGGDRGGRGDGGVGRGERGGFGRGDVGGRGDGGLGRGDIGGRGNIGVGRGGDGLGRGDIGGRGNIGVGRGVDGLGRGDIGGRGNIGVGRGGDGLGRGDIGGRGNIGVGRGGDGLGRGDIGGRGNIGVGRGVDGLGRGDIGGRGNIGVGRGGDGLGRGDRIGIVRGDVGGRGDGGLGRGDRGGIVRGVFGRGDIGGRGDGGRGRGEVGGRGDGGGRVGIGRGDGGGRGVLGRGDGGGRGGVGRSGFVQGGENDGRPTPQGMSESSNFQAMPGPQSQSGYQAAEKPTETPPPPMQQPSPAKPQQTAAKPLPKQAPERSQPQPSPAKSQQQPSPVKSQPRPAVEQERKALSALERLALKETSSGLHPPLRKSVGQAGFKYEVETNHLPLAIKVKEIIHYDVTIEPDKPKKFMKHVMELVRNKCYPQRHPAFDGRKNLYSSGFLDFGKILSTEVNFSDNEHVKDLEYKVTIKFVARIDTSLLETYMRIGTSNAIPQSIIQAIDVVLRSAPSLRFTPVGRSYFTPPRAQTINLGEGMELWYGFYQSAILGWKPYLNFDVSHKGFPKSQNCICLIEELFHHLDPLRFDEIETLLKNLKGLKVNYEIPGMPNSRRTYKVNSLKGSACAETFEHEGQRMTVEQYYARIKGYKLRYPHLPCLHLGSPEKKMYMPIELCTVGQGQVVRKKLTALQTTNMIRHATTPADVRKRKIMEALHQVDFGNDQTLREFGISIGQNFERVPARILDPPEIKFSRGNVARGVWNTDKFFQGMEIKNWTIVNLDFRTRREKIDEFAKEMVRSGQMLGMRISPPNIEIVDIRRKDWNECLRPKGSVKPDITVVIIPEAKGVYEKVKQTAELKFGVLTQCVKGSTIFRMKPATVNNILLKVNSKLNGTNHVIANRLTCFKRPIMIVGADVTHPSPEAEAIPSAAAVTASFDLYAFKYAVRYHLQPPGAEIIEDLENIMKQLLMTFYQRNNKVKPEKIVMFRDGVSDGQFATVLNKELMAIRRACASMEAGYQPKITFLVVQKRHHTRFFPPPKFEDGRNKNVPAGTIVDSHITHPTELDFYLVSHASIQGTSRPTKYHLLWDDSDFSTDELEALTYHLCHTFSRCTRSVSYPAPTYYAHLVAFRARAYIDDGTRLNMDNLQREQDNRRIDDNIINNWPMFFV